MLCALPTFLHGAEAIGRGLCHLIKTGNPQYTCQSRAYKPAPSVVTATPDTELPPNLLILSTGFFTLEAFRKPEPISDLNTPEQSHLL